ncbi:hypothetical protein PENSPDRAFT_585547, partial [Peniophora sp. CONT]
RSREFDRLRKQLLAQFQSSETLTTRVDDIAKRKLQEDEKLARKAPEEVRREVMQELDRFLHYISVLGSTPAALTVDVAYRSYPILERALADLVLPSNPVFTEDIRTHVKRVVQGI